jgi:hypothetical protein
MSFWSMDRGHATIAAMPNCRSLVKPAIDDLFATGEISDRARIRQRPIFESGWVERERQLGCAPAALALFVAQEDPAKRGATLFGVVTPFLDEAFNALCLALRPDGASPYRGRCHDTAPCVSAKDLCILH